MPESWDPPPEEARAVGFEVGVRDVEGAWTKFVCHYVAKGAAPHTRREWLALWRKWCVDERKREQRAPARARGMVQPVAPERAWKMGGAE